MGAVSLKIGDGTARFRRSTVCSSALRILMLLSIVITNLFALYAFKYAPAALAGQRHRILPQGDHFALVSDRLSLIVREIESSQKKLSQIEREILGYGTLDLSKPNLAPELKQFLSRHPLPLGRDSRSGITVMVSSVGHSCSNAMDLLSLYMAYKPGDLCPDDADLQQKLISKGCEPLPRRRCRSRISTKLELLPLASEKIDGQTWMTAKGKNDFLIDDVLAMGKNIRIGFDVGGGAGNFAARMAEKNVTVVTSSMDSRDLVSARGLFSLFLSPWQRFPFHDSIFDIVHTMHGIESGAETGPEKLEFFLFDADRVLRPGGLLWLDNWYLADEKKKAELTVLIEKFGYRKLKWVVGEKADPSGSGKKICLSAVLQKLGSFAGVGDHVHELQAFLAHLLHLRRRENSDALDAGDEFLPWIISNQKNIILVVNVDELPSRTARVVELTLEPEHAGNGVLQLLVVSKSRRVY